MTPEESPPRSADPGAILPPSGDEGTARAESPSTDFMILPDGTIYARNLTPDLAGILADLNPQDASMAVRAVTARSCKGVVQPSESRGALSPSPPGRGPG